MPSFLLVCLFLHMILAEPSIQIRLRPTEWKVWLIFLHQLVRSEIHLSFFFFLSPNFSSASSLYVLFSFSHLLSTSVFGSNSDCRSSNLSDSSNWNILVVPFRSVSQRWRVCASLVYWFSLSLLTLDGSWQPWAYGLIVYKCLESFSHRVDSSATSVRRRGDQSVCAFSHLVKSMCICGWSCVAIVHLLGQGRCSGQIWKVSVIFVHVIHSMLSRDLRTVSVTRYERNVKPYSNFLLGYPTEANDETNGWDSKKRITINGLWLFLAIYTPCIIFQAWIHFCATHIHILSKRNSL